MMIHGLCASLHIRTVSAMAARSGPGGETGGAVIDPQAMLSSWMGVNKTSIGKSSSTGPGALDVVVRQPKDTRQEISPTLVMR